MIKTIRGFAVILGLLIPQAAFAQADDGEKAQIEALSQCLSMKSTGSDRIAFAGWMLAAMSAAPQLKGEAIVAPERRDQLNHDVARISTRLLTIDCRTEAHPLFKAGNTKAFSSAFGVFGRLAMQELTANPEAAQAMEEFAKYINQADFADLKK